MQQADTGNSGELDGAGLRIGIVRARFNAAITEALAAACLAELGRLEVEEGDITTSPCPARWRFRWC